MRAQARGRRETPVTGSLHQCLCNKLVYSMASPSDDWDYLAKLKLTSGEQLPDPTKLTSGEWSMSLKQWPPLEFPQIHLYLINTPSVYTHCNKGAYKSMDAYNFVMCGHVHRVKYHSISKDAEYCFLMAEVLPSQRQGHTAQLYKAWVCLHKKDGHVLSAHCTCMAGNGSVCSHAAALLFKVEIAVRTGLTQPEACTSKASAWNDMSKRKVDPAPLTEIKFTKPKPQSSGKKGKKQKQTETTEKEIKEISMADIHSLKEIFPRAAVLTSVDDGEGCTTETDTASEGDGVIPQPLTGFFDVDAFSLDQPQLEAKCVRILSTMTNHYHPEQLENLETVTREQALSPVWHEHRRGRITASVIYDVCLASDFNAEMSLTERIMGYKSQYDNEAMKWGRENEKNARNAYFDYVKENHEIFSLSDSGLVVPHQTPYIGASPDGVINCKCCGKGVLELKCPFKYRSKLENFENDESFCLSSSGALKETHRYFYQVQTQMYACDLGYSDFVVWTTNGFKVQRIMRNQAFIDETLNKVSTFFTKYLLPEIVTRKHDISQTRNALCFSCDRGKFGKIIFCTAEICHKMYHYECVGLKRMRKNWVCQNCDK